MADLGTKYMGLDLKNPLIVGSSGLTRSVEAVKKCEAAGAGAVVLKSVFEEQIEAQVDGLVASSKDSLWHSEAMDYITQYGRENEVERYLELIREAKSAVSIPVIASIHCVTAGTWTEFASRVENAGADGLELNVFVLPSDAGRDGSSMEQVYFDIASGVRESSKLPIALKVGSYFSSVAKTLTDLGRSGVSALVLFNRFYRIDFDVERMELVSGGAFSSPDEIALPLRWISLLSGEIPCDLAASTGIHDGAAVVKQLLAGASAVQLCSVLYRNGVEDLGRILSEVEDGMARHDLGSVAEFRGRLSQQASLNPSAYERVQFMRRSVEQERV